MHHNDLNTKNEVDIDEIMSSNKNAFEEIEVKDQNGNTFREFNIKFAGLSSSEDQKMKHVIDEISE